jgi:hypothetical protein
MMEQMASIFMVQSMTNMKIVATPALAPVPAPAQNDHRLHRHNLIYNNGRDAFFRRRNNDRNFYGFYGNSNGLGEYHNNMQYVNLAFLNNSGGVPNTSGTFDINSVFVSRNINYDNNSNVVASRGGINLNRMMYPPGNTGLDQSNPVHPIVNPNSNTPNASIANGENIHDTIRQSLQSAFSKCFAELEPGKYHQWQQCSNEPHKRKHQ